MIEDENHETIVISHDTVVMDPLTAKMFLKVFQENLKSFEDKFGDIAVPEQKSEVTQTTKKNVFSYIG